MNEDAFWNTKEPNIKICEDCNGKGEIEVLNECS